jgi:hypothetical protein
VSEEATYCHHTIDVEAGDGRDDEVVVSVEGESAGGWGWSKELILWAKTG